MPSTKQTFDRRVCGLVIMLIRSVRLVNHLSEREPVTLTGVGLSYVADSRSTGGQEVISGDLEIIGDGERGYRSVILSREYRVFWKVF